MTELLADGNRTVLPEVIDPDLTRAEFEAGVARYVANGCVGVIEAWLAAATMAGSAAPDPQRYVFMVEPLLPRWLFAPTKQPGLGTGLGMAMAHDFVSQSGGAISVRSSLGQGTTVSLWLPACEAPSEPLLPADLAAIEAPAERGLALLVEDGIEAMQMLDQTPRQPRR